MFVSIVLSTVFPVSKNVKTMTKHAISFIKKLLKKLHVYKNKKYCLLWFSNVIIQTNSSYSDIC